MSGERRGLSAVFVLVTRCYACEVYLFAVLRVWVDDVGKRCSTKPSRVFAVADKNAGPLRAIWLLDPYRFAFFKECHQRILADRELFGAAPSAAHTSAGSIRIVCGR